MTAASRSKIALLVFKTLVFSFLVPGTVSILIPGMLIGDFPAERLSLGNYFGVVPFGLGWTIYVWCAFSFVNNGQGTPAPIDPPQALVKSGLYKFVRNPMYIAMLLVLLGEAIFFDSRSLLYYVGGFAVFVFTFVLCFEEPRLKRKFGRDYRHYCQSTSRWLPFVKPFRQKHQTPI